VRSFLPTVISTGHDARYSLIRPSGHQLYLPHSISTTNRFDQLLRQNAVAIAQARNEGVVSEIAATIRHNQRPLFTTNSRPTSFDLLQQQQRQHEQALLQQILLRNSSSRVFSNLGPTFPDAALSVEATYLQMLQQQQRAESLRTDVSAILRNNRSDTFSSPSFPGRAFSIAPPQDAWGTVPLPSTATATMRRITTGHLSAPLRPPSTRTLSSGWPRSLPVTIARPSDAHKLTEYQCLLRQQMEVFEAEIKDVETHMRGRNKPITVGQVGIRCRHCAHLPVRRRQKGAVYFPSTKHGLYQAAQNMATAHMPVCLELPTHTREMMLHLKATSSAGAGRRYWSHGATQLGLVDTADRGIRFVLRNADSNAA
jgi:hypothetical protein